jgi:hypothetical protein
VRNYADHLDPVDDQMKRITGFAGEANDAVADLAKVKGHWVAVPSRSGT